MESTEKQLMRYTDADVDVDDVVFLNFRNIGLVVPWCNLNTTKAFLQQLSLDFQTKRTDSEFRCSFWQLSHQTSKEGQIHFL